MSNVSKIPLTTERLNIPLLDKLRAARGGYVPLSELGPDLVNVLGELDALPKNDETLVAKLSELQKAFRQHARDDKRNLRLVRRLAGARRSGLKGMGRRVA